MPPDDAGGWEPLDGADRVDVPDRSAHHAAPADDCLKEYALTTVNEPAPRMTLIKDGIAAQLHDIDPEETNE